MRDERSGDEISRKVELAWLMAFYGGMLTDKQREVLTLHCEEDLSLAEIAENAGISRQGVHDTVKRCTKQLKEYEAALHLVEKFQNMKSKLTKASELLEISAEATDVSNIEEARHLLKEMLEEL